MDKQAILQQLPDYQPTPWLCGGHLQTIWAKTITLQQPDYHRQLIADSTGLTHVAYDFVVGNPHHEEIIVLFHGLEGGSDSHYAKSLMNYLHLHRRNGVVVHYRGCGNIENTAPIFYHSGDSAEIHHVLQQLKKCYKTVYAAGVSLGGNALAKYLGETQENALCDAAISISAPFNLQVAEIALRQFISSKIYIPYFLKTLKPKVLNIINSPEQRRKIQFCRSLTEFDDIFTAPTHGFQSAQDYYQQASSFPYLKLIHKPTLLINAQNDPFYLPCALPQESDVSQYTYLLQPKCGGHAGFISGTKGKQLTWLPNTVLDFFDIIKNNKNLKTDNPYRI